MRRVKARIGRLAAGLGGLGLLVALALVVAGVRIDPLRVPGFGLVQVLAGVLPLYLLAVFLLRRRPDNDLFTYAMVAVGMWAFVVGLEAAMTLGLTVSGPGGWFWAANLVYQTASVVVNLSIIAALVRFPDGDVERPWQRRLLVAMWALIAVPPLLLLASPQLVVYPLVVDPSLALSSPFAVAGLAAIGPPLAEVYRLHYASVVIGGVVAVGRYRRAGAELRRRMRWLFVASAVFVAVIVAFALALALDAPPWVATVVGGALVSVEIMFALSIAYGVVRHQFFDIHVVLHRSIVYGALVLGIAALYAVVASVPGLALGRYVPVELAVGLTILAALLFQPARTWLTGLADRWVFGQRADPAAMLLDLGSALEQTIDVTELLPRIAAAVRDGVGAPWVRVTLAGSGTGTVAGSVDAQPAELEVTLERGGEQLGCIECGRREPAYTERERELLHRLAGQAATAIANLRLTAQLARSRERLVQAADGERRRIERDIHDGVQQGIVAVLTKLSLARNQVGRGTRPTDEVLTELQDDVRTLLTDLRELAHGIHPPVLSDRGLVAAIRARTDRLPVAVVLHASAGLTGRRFGPDVEGATYFVVCEAITNVVKHAAALVIDVELSAGDGHLCVDIRDDGAGFDGNGEGGRGVLGMRDRVEALGGRLAVESVLGRGTRVHAELPIGAGDG